MTDVTLNGQNTTVPFPTVKEDLKDVKVALEDIRDSMTRVAAERDLIKEKKKHLKVKFGLNPKLVSRLAKTMFNDDFVATTMDHEEFVDAYKKVVGA